LIASVITRWGTQFRLLQSLLDSRDAICRVTTIQGIEFQYVTTVQDHSFWIKLSELVHFLKPLHELQKMSEDNKATIYYVFERWLSISTHLHKTANSSSFFAGTITSFLLPTQKNSFDSRVNMQLTPLHIAGYYLQPLKWDYTMDNNTQEKIKAWIKSWAGRSWVDAMQQFFAFRNREGSFHSTNPVWELAGNPVLFWRFQQATCPELASAAVNLLTIIANSIPSERAFSTISLINSKTRNRLSVETTSKLQFIHINQRALNQQYYELPDMEALLAAEDEYMALQDGLIAE
jgi:hypothetical protein